MKNIKQSVEVQFSAVEVNDVIKLLPIMDAISRSLDERRELEIRIHGTEFMTISIECLKTMYMTLRDLGFCNSLSRDPKIISQPNK
jgi:hypothetical protein